MLLVEISGSDMNLILPVAIGGTLGAGGSWLLIVALPAGYRLMEGKGAPQKFAWWRVIGAAVTFVGMLCGGAITALATSTDLKTAVMAGLALQGTLRSLQTAVRPGARKRKGKKGIRLREREGPAGRS